ncbi:lyase family protein [Nannocystis pusilla]|uniref:lyase family protein n=1 Tax=Nannocystis pusilla TaxID=889268 RepID=UPI003DA3AC4D
MPVYSQFQPGQPGVLAYYLWSLDAALARDQQALAQLVDELQVCPLGAGAGAGTDFPIRPQVTAAWLGFSTSHRSALDAVASRDLALRLLGAWAVCSTNLSRLAQDLQLWTMADVGLFTLPDELAGGSSLMPQKKNPYLLEIVKGKLVALPSALGFALHAMQKTPFSNAVEVGTEGVSQCGASATALADSCDLLRLMIEGLAPRPGRGEALARRGVVVATQVANALVRAEKMTFHEAHRAVGSRIAGALNVGGDPLAALAGLTQETFDDVGAAARALRHGGGPGVVGEQLGEASGALRRDADEFHRRSSVWSVAERRRSAAVQALIARVHDPGAGGSDD